MLAIIINCVGGIVVEYDAKVVYPILLQVYFYLNLTRAPRAQTR
jgi:hypothetical protein